MSEPSASTDVITRLGTDTAAILSHVTGTCYPPRRHRALSVVQTYIDSAGDQVEPEQIVRHSRPVVAGARRKDLGPANALVLILSTTGKCAGGTLGHPPSESVVFAPNTLFLTLDAWREPDGRHIVTAWDAGLDLADPPPGFNAAAAEIRRSVAQAEVAAFLDRYRNGSTHIPPISQSWSDGPFADSASPASGTITMPMSAFTETPE